MTASDGQEGLNDPVPRVVGSTSQECEDEIEVDMAASEETACARFIAQMDIASPEVLRVMPAVTLQL